MWRDVNSGPPHEGQMFFTPVHHLISTPWLPTRSCSGSGTGPTSRGEDSSSVDISVSGLMCVCVWGEVDEVVFGRWDDMWLCLSRAETQSDIISPAPGQLMWYLLSPWPPNPVSSGRSHLQCKTISAYLKRQFLQSIDYKLHLENGIILTKGYSLSSRGPEGDPSFFNNLYVWLFGQSALHL